jgi:hypothetical protein
MNNLTAREKGFMYVITLLIIVVLGYFFGIRTLNNKYDEYKKQLASLEERRAYLEQIRANNAEMETEITALIEANKKLELSFIDQLDSESIEQYVLKTFEQAGCPYLKGITATDVGMPGVAYPDGTPSPDGLVSLLVTVSYVTTDGYTVPGYNRNPDFTPGAETPPAETALAMKDQMGQGDNLKRIGYDEFIKAVKKINSDNTNCIKVNDIEATSINGYMELKASISFYGTSLTNRLSVDESKEPYTNWTGSTTTDTKGGFIGFPYICDNEDSLWYGCINKDHDYKAHKPFATYWANYLFTKDLEKAGSIEKLLKFGEPKPTEAPADDAKNNKKN